jgi:hypothetical protein
MPAPRSAQALATSTSNPVVSGTAAAHGATTTDSLGHKTDLTENCTDTASAEFPANVVVPSKVEGPALPLCSVQFRSIRLLSVSKVSDACAAKYSGAGDLHVEASLGSDSIKIHIIPSQAVCRFSVDI